MTKEILIKVQMNCDKCRRKAMKLIVAAQGVDSVAIDGEDKDHFLVTGDNIDCVKLTTTLRKKVGRGRADIVTLNEVKKEEAKAEKNKTQWVPGYYPHPYVVYYPTGCNEYPDSCSIM